MKVEVDWIVKTATVTLKIESEDDVDWREEFKGDTNNLEWIRNELRGGNGWAWCRVEVIVAFQGFEEREYLGGCSYENETAFKRCGYYTDMVKEGADKIAAAFQKLVDTHGLWEHETKSCLLCIADG